MPACHYLTRVTRGEVPDLRIEVRQAKPGSGLSCTKSILITNDRLQAAAPLLANTRGRSRPSGLKILQQREQRGGRFPRCPYPCSLQPLQFFMVRSSVSLEGQHITRVSCQGNLVAIFTQADGSCLSYKEMSTYKRNDEGDETGYVCLFHSASREPVHVLRQPEDFDPAYDRLRSTYSPCSSYLMVNWSPDTVDKLNVACLSKAECTQRTVGSPCQLQGAVAACTHQMHAHAANVLAKCPPFACAAPGPAVSRLSVGAFAASASAARPHM